MAQKSKVLTFESWVTKKDWFRYATSNPDHVPHLLSDRSPCQDPFFDLFAHSAGERRPMITGLCRCLRNFNVGDRYIYVTRLCPDAARRRKLDIRHGPCYLGVASMIVMNVGSSHEGASREFHPCRYVVAPLRTPYPPGLAHNARPIAAVSRESCIIYAESESCQASSNKEVALTPDQSTNEQWHAAYSLYHERQANGHLRVAFCQYEVDNGREALATTLEEAPVFFPSDREGVQMNVMGVFVREETGQALTRRIAEGRPPAG